MTPEFDEATRKEVQDLIERQVFFTTEILSLMNENFDLKKKLVLQGLEIELLNRKINDK